MTARELESVARAYLTIGAKNAGGLILSLKYSYIGWEKRNMPAIAPKDSCREMLPAAKGFDMSMSVIAKDNEVVRSFTLPMTGASRRRLSMIPALTADGGEPTITTNAHTSPMHSRDERLFLPMILCKTPTRKATCIPDTATTCASPDILIEA